MKRLPPVLALAGLVLVLAYANLEIAQKSRLIRQGQLLLLELQPVDPRSLIQGDYMQLRYASRAFPPAGSMAGWPATGTVVLQLDAHRVGRFVRRDDGSPLAADELRLRYRSGSLFDRGEMRYGAESYFFQEGQAAHFQQARYGMLRVADDGTSVLTGLADSQHRQIRPE